MRISWYPARRRPEYTLRGMTGRLRSCDVSARHVRLCVLVLLMVSATAGMRAHDIPSDVTVQAYVRPEGQQLQLIIRAPIAAMRDVVFPTREDGTLDIARADSAVRQAALLWIADAIAIYEGNRRLEPPRIRAIRISLPSERAFVSYRSARAHVTAPPLPVDTRIVAAQALMDVRFEYRHSVGPIGVLDRSPARAAWSARGHRAAAGAAVGPGTRVRVCG